MAWTYEQATGMLLHDGQPYGRGYSGRADGRNDPAMESVEGVGPIPRGAYRIGRAFSHPKLGPVTMRLFPAPGADTHGRSGFCMHGNNAANDASHGCIILGPKERTGVDQAVAQGDDQLEVVE
jgi:hypothetical protein